MKTTNKKNNVLKKVAFLAIFVYLLYIFIHQQKVLNSYKDSQNYYRGQIEEKVAYRDRLYETKKDINSEKYIEEMAREKLDMYLPNEMVFIDL